MTLCLTLCLKESSLSFIIIWLNYLTFTWLVKLMRCWYTTVTKLAGVKLTYYFYISHVHILPQTSCTPSLAQKHGLRHCIYLLGQAWFLHHMQPCEKDKKNAMRSRPSNLWGASTLPFFPWASFAESMQENLVSRWYFGGLSSTAAACFTHPLDLIKVKDKAQ